MPTFRLHNVFFFKLNISILQSYLVLFVSIDRKSLIRKRVPKKLPTREWWLAPGLTLLLGAEDFFEGTYFPNDMLPSPLSPPAEGSTADIFCFSHNTSLDIGRRYCSAMLWSPPSLLLKENQAGPAFLFSSFQIGDKVGKVMALESA